MPEEQPDTDPFVEHDDPAGRARWFYSSRVDAQGNISYGLIARASAQRHRMAREFPLLVEPGGPGSVNWTPLGPAAVAHGQATGNPIVNGRFTALAVGPGGQRIYAGAANGGVWFSADGGTSWTPLDDYSTSPTYHSGLEANSLSVGAIAVQFGQTREQDIIYVGTGEPQSDLDRPKTYDAAGGAYFGIGVRVSQGGGAAGTWVTEAPNLAGHGIFKLVLDPDVPGRVFAATTTGVFRRGIVGGNPTWEQVAPGVVSDVIVVGTGGSKRYYAAWWGTQVYVSSTGNPNNANDWTPVAGFDRQSNPGRMVLAASEGDPPVIYVLCENGNLYRMDRRNNEHNFTQVQGVPRALFSLRQGFYDIVLAVDPGDRDTVYLGGDAIKAGQSRESWDLSFYKGTIKQGQDGQWRFPFDPAHDIADGDTSRVPLDATWIGRGIHSDIHTLAFATNADGRTHNGTIVWIGTDGGLFQSTRSGQRASFTACNISEAVVQMTYLAQRLDTDAVLFGGCQDNGTLRYWGDQAWYEAAPGDGGGVAINPMNPTQIMLQYEYTSLWRSSRDPGNPNLEPLNFPPVTNTQDTEQQKAAQIEHKITNFYGPVKALGGLFAVFGTNRLWLTQDWGTTWVTLPSNTNPYTLGFEARILAQDTLDGAIRAIAYDGRIIYAATQNSVWSFSRSDSSRGSGWIRRQIPTNGLPDDRFITALAADEDQTSLYMTLGGSTNDHVWHYEFATETWQSAHLTDTGDQPVNVPAHAVAIGWNKDPDNVAAVIYVGTDVGCWKGIKRIGGAPGTWKWTWSLFSQGLPECAITDLLYHVDSGLLRAATHGRGVWEISLLDLETNTPGRATDLYLRANDVDSGRMSNGARFPWVSGTFDGVPVLDPRTAQQVSLGYSPDIKVRRASQGSWPGQPNYLDFAYHLGETYAPQNAQEMVIDASGTNQVFIQVHNRGLSPDLTPIAGDKVRVLLLLNLIGGIMPNDYASHINAQDTTTAWLGPGWFFVDPVNPYHALPGPLDVRTPQVVSFDFDLKKTFGAAPPPINMAYSLVAFVITTDATDQVTSSGTFLNDAILHDKHIGWSVVLKPYP